jgi:hypothetical protein
LQEGWWVVALNPDVHPNAPGGGCGTGFSKARKPLGSSPTIDVADFTRGPVGTDPFVSALAANAQPALAVGPGGSGSTAAGGAPPVQANKDEKEEKPVVDSAIEMLDLVATAKKAAYELKKAKPSVIFTSGRRDKDEQASAMTSNVVQERDWIKSTYAKSAARDACQKWVDDNKDAVTQKEIADGLKGVLDGLTDAQLNALSKHLSGQAFDVQPVTPDKDDIKGAIKKLKGITKFLEKEGNLVRWHAEF